MPLLTLHRPNFCAECGTKILRLRWRLWTNRKFCDSCAAKLRKQRWTEATAVIVIAFLAGFVIAYELKTPPPPLIIQRTETRSASVNSASAASTNTQPATIEEIYICGARTKKGKPCSRRVHGPVRCWQHKGEKAMLPQEKLVIK